MSDQAHDTPGAGGLPASWWLRGFGLVICGFLLAAGLYLLIDHTVHVFWALPYLLLLSCPLMHLFMHHGHGGHQPKGSGTPAESEARHGP